MKTKHTAQSGQTYFQHLVFAVEIGLVMLLSACFFIMHGIVPWIPVPSKLNLHEMSMLLLDKDLYLENRKGENPNE